MKMLKTTPQDLAYFGRTVSVEPISQRIKIYQMPTGEELNSFLDRLKLVAKDTNCDKLIFYLRDHQTGEIKQHGACYEGKIKGFFNGATAYIYALFLDPARHKTDRLASEKKVFDVIQKRQQISTNFELPTGYQMRWADLKDAKQMANLYQTVFQSYPTPMNDPVFIEEMMQSDVYFLVVQHNGMIVSACSADILPHFRSAELSDCATYPEHRAKQLLSYQVAHLIPKVKKMGIRTLFSYSRANSVGMNLVNVKHGFTFGGRMVQNSNIAGSMENMNIWYKVL
ncbi:putative beta-lysine N-acetyltransferase [Gracilibacillus sp. YIM 98692]|uniref:putative beta-lysine N-acetyltransferase n=1 Tax=Gracilibacillus sp. YIM 98692 TaxID=2663532 RepID=UPI0013D2AA74|nr:putative beta-lysine N-acetyltransferase [Gracilibacillus sp. YIM 98692]